MSREILAQCEIRVSREFLSVEIFRVGGSYVCERSLKERDGTESTQCFSFDKTDQLSKFLISDPFYIQHQSEFDTLFKSVGKIINVE